MDYVALSKTSLFRGSTPDEVAGMLSCLGATTQRFAKGEMLCRMGETVPALGLVLSGSALIQNDDVWGNTAVIDRVGPGQIFAETYACIPGERLLVNVMAAESGEVLWLRMGRVLEVCTHACAHHNRLIHHLLMLSAQKNLQLSRKILHTSPRTIRGRLLSYLSQQAVSSGSRTFTIPFNRQQLADYLNVDRSALSAELGKMQKEGLLQTERSCFTLRAATLLPED